MQKDLEQINLFIEKNSKRANPRKLPTKYKTFLDSQELMNNKNELIWEYWKKYNNCKRLFSMNLTEFCKAYSIDFDGPLIEQFLVIESAFESESKDVD